jgi:hypothetical protein
MSIGVGFHGVFTIDLWEDEQLIQTATFPNQILRVGLLIMVRRGIAPPYFDHIVVGSSGDPVSPAQIGVLSQLGRVLGEVTEDLPRHQWGFSGTFGPGVATGEWREIGMQYYRHPNDDTFLNRALIVDGAGVPISIQKGPLTRAKVSVQFSILRG